MASGYLPHPLSSGELIAELAARAPKVGANTGVWPGLTIYRFTGPAGPTWEEIQSLSLCIVAQGRKAVTIDGRAYTYDPFHYLVLGSHLHFQAEILEASVGRPFLSFVLQIDPALVRQVSSDMLERRTTAFRSREAATQPAEQACVSALDQDLLGVVLRFLRSVGTGTDRRVLAPLYLQEMVYRVLQREQYARLLALAAAESASNPVSAVLEYVRGHLSEPLTVADGNVLAYSNRCPHQASALDEGDLDGDTLTCAKHMWEFNAATGCGINPDNAQLRSFGCKGR